jgi:hypothetical protein
VNDLDEIFEMREARLEDRLRNTLATAVALFTIMGFFAFIPILVILWRVAV